LRLTDVLQHVGAKDNIVVVIGKANQFMRFLQVDGVELVRGLVVTLIAIPSFPIQTRVTAMRVIPFREAGAVVAASHIQDSCPWLGKDMPERVEAMG